MIGSPIQVGSSLMAEEKNAFDLIADILRITTSGTKESEILADLNLDRDLWEKYIPAIVALKLVSVQNQSENSYRTTNRGLEFLRFYHGLHWLLWGKDGDFLLINALSKLKKTREPYYVR